MSRRTPGRIAQLAVLAVLCAAAPAGCAGDDGGEPDARTDARDVVPDAPGGDVPTDLGTDATEPPLEWVEPHGEELPSGSVITPEAGGTIVGDDGRVMVSFPPGAVAVPTTVTLGPLAVTPPTDASDLGLAIDVDARDPDGQPVTELAGTAYLYFRHAALESLPAPAADLVVHAHDDDAASGDDDGWTALPTASSPDGGSSMARTRHFSGFGLYARALTGFLGCKPGGGCLTSINETNPISSMGMDGQGNLYFMHPNGPYIYRLPAGGGPADVEIFFNAADAFSGTWLYKNYITVSDRTGDVYLMRNDQVFRITPNKSWSLLYPPASETGVKVQAARIDPNDGTLWVQCRDDFTTDTLRQIDGSGTVTKTVAFNTTTRRAPEDGGWAFDSQGRLFGLRGWSLYVLEDPVGSPDEPWHLVAEGFPGTRRAITADGSGNVFVASGMALCPSGSTCILDEASRSHQIAVVNGTPAFPNQRIAGLRNPTMVVRSGNRLLVSGGDSIVTLPLDRRDRLDGNATQVTSPSMGSLSGRGSFVKLVGKVASSPVHHAVFMGGVRLPLAQVLPGELRFTIPSFEHRWEWAQNQLPNLGTGARMTLPSGEVTARVGPGSRSLGAIQTPEPGHYKPTTYDTINGSGSCLSGDEPLAVAVGEWVYWRAPSFPGAQPEDQSWSVTSHDGLFAPWVAAEDGPWMAYRFTQQGGYTFDWVQGDQTLSCAIQVTAGGASGYATEFLVDPAVGGTFFSNGARMVVPPGALPGTAPYALLLTTVNQAPPASDTPSPTSAPGRYRQFYRFTPEPAHLSSDLRFGVPLGNGDEYPMPAFFDNGAADGVPEAYQQSMYIPIEHRVDGGAGYVDVVLAAGDYGPRETSAEPRRAGGPATPLVQRTLLGAVSWLGQRIMEIGVNEIGGYLWWKVGLPNEKVEDDHFTILYNTREGMTEDKALAVHEGLTMARTHFMTRGYIVPESVIVTLDPGLDSEGSTSGLGRLAHWNMTLGGWQANDDLRSSAAHELFHIIQYENMSYAARARKTTWGWWMEGTAVWAEEVLFPGQNSAADWVKKGSDFIHQGIRNYGSLSDEQEYACVALILHLEKKDEGIVLEVLQSLGLLTTPEDALRDKIASMPTMLEEFAVSYFGGVDEPYRSWDLSKAFVPQKVLANPSTQLIDVGMPSESAIAVKAATDPTKTLPVSFDEASGSVVRGDHKAMLQTTFVLDKTGTELGSQIGTTKPEGIVLGKASTYDPTNPLTVIHVNAEYDSFARTSTVSFDVPTLDSVSPASFDYESSVTLTLNGGGFGPSDGGNELRRVLVFYGEREASEWGPGVIKVSLPANSVTPMSVPIQVRNSAGVTSNTRYVEATN
jgi:hypothetical protein